MWLQRQILVLALVHLLWFSICFVVQGSCCSVISSPLVSKPRVILPCAATLFLSFRGLWRQKNASCYLKLIESAISMGATVCFVTRMLANLWTQEAGCAGYWSKWCWKDCAAAKGFIPRVSCGLPSFPDPMLRLVPIVCNWRYIFSKLIKDIDSRWSCNFDRVRYLGALSF